MRSCMRSLFAEGARREDSREEKEEHGNPKTEGRNSKEGRNPKAEGGFELRDSGFFRPSDFGLRVWRPASTADADLLITKEPPSGRLSIPPGVGSKSK
jgi:hypothetical protein